MPPRGSVPIPPVPAHIAIPSDDDYAWHYVYFAEDSGSGLIKIGSSYRPRLMIRMRELDKMLGRPVILRALVDGNHRVERGLHARFKDAREHGEWFRPVPELLTFIELANASAWTPEGITYWGEWADLLTAEQAGDGEAA